MVLVLGGVDIKGVAVGGGGTDDQGTPMRGGPAVVDGAVADVKVTRRKERTPRPLLLIFGDLAEGGEEAGVDRVVLVLRPQAPTAAVGGGLYYAL